MSHLHRWVAGGAVALLTVAMASCAPSDTNPLTLTQRMSQCIPAEAGSEAFMGVIASNVDEREYRILDVQPVDTVGLEVVDTVVLGWEKNRGYMIFTLPVDYSGWKDRTSIGSGVTTSVDHINLGLVVRKTDADDATVSGLDVTYEHQGRTHQVRSDASFLLSSEPCS